MTRRPAVCGYCGTSTTDWTRDHVVPSTLWGGKGHLPKNPVIVRVCDECKLLYDSDAEYFRNRLYFMLEKGSHPILKPILQPKVSKSLDRSPAVSSELFGNLMIDYDMTESGIVTGRALKAEIDIPRFNRIIEKIVRGFHFLFSNHNLPPTHEVRVFPGNGFWNLEPFKGALNNNLPKLMLT